MPLRPSTADDHEAVLDLLAARDRVDFGEPNFTASLVLDQWRSRHFAPGRDAVVVEDAGEIIGYAAAFQPGDLAFVHPVRHREGIGTRLLTWLEDSARPRATFRQRVGASNDGARALLEAADYRLIRSVHFLGWAGEPPLPQRRVPEGFALEGIALEGISLEGISLEGISLEGIDSDQAARELHELDTVGFSENADYQPESFEAFSDEHLSNADLDHLSSRIARAEGRPVGFVLCRRAGAVGYIDLLAVIPDARRRGVGQALLCHALRALADQGVSETRLDVASDNPRALRLYRRLGMTDRHEVLVFEKAAGGDGVRGGPRSTPSTDSP